MAPTSETDQVVLITGASAGIGVAAARLFAAQGARLALAARRVERLEELAQELRATGREVLVLPADLADEVQVEALVPRVLAELGRLDVLVNNAGYGLQCRFERMAAADVARMFAVNLLAPMALARQAIEPMRRQGGGSIVNVASVGGLVAHPFNVSYCASKHALVGFSKSLRLELWGSGVRVTAVCPASTRTEFFERARGELPFAGLISTFQSPPEKVARAILRASRGKRAVVHPTIDAWFLSFADRFLPWASARGNLMYREQVLKLAQGLDSDES